VVRPDTDADGANPDDDTDAADLGTEHRDHTPGPFEVPRGTGP